VVEVGGRCVLVERTLEDALAQSGVRVARKVVSLCRESGRANVDLASVSDPHDLQDVDFCVLPAELGVARTAPVGSCSTGGPNRREPSHPAPGGGVRADALVHNLHEAYARVTVPFPGIRLWLSGPSKTADIERRW